MTNVHRKKRAALCITAVAACLSLSVGCGNTWNQTYGGPESDEARCVLPVATGGFVAAGSTNSFGSGGSDAWMVGTDVWGNALWNVAIGGEADDHARSIEQTNEGGFILAGRTSSSGAGGEDAWLVKTDSGGNEQWSATFGGTGDDRADSLVQTADGGYLLAGSTASAGAGGLDGWVVMADPDGNGVWSETFGGPLDDQLRCIRQTADGGYIMAGQTNSYGSGGRDAWLIKLDAARGEEWSRTFGGGNSEGALWVEQTADGGYIVAGNAQMEYGGFPGGMLLIKTDSAGLEEWNKVFFRGPDSGSGAYSVQQTQDGGYIMAGTETSIALNVTARLVKTDALGDIDWHQGFGGPYFDLAYCVRQVTPDLGYIMAGSTASYSDPPGYDLWLVRTDGSGQAPAAF